MNRSERRLLANSLTHQLRRGWEIYAEHSMIGNPNLRPSSGGYSSGGRFQKPECLATYETTRYEFVRAYVPSDQTLHTRGIAFHLLRTKHNQVISNLRAETQADYEFFIHESRAAPFHHSGGRLRRDERRCPQRAAIALLRLVDACTVEIVPELDEADAYADTEELVDLEELRRAVGLRELALA